MGHRWLLLTDSDEFIANNVFYGEGQSSVMHNDQTLYEYLENPSAPTPISVYDMRNETCYLLPRLLFSAVEEEDPENSIHGDIKGFDPNKFATTRFFHFANPADRKVNGYGKVLMNLNKIPFEDISRGGFRTVHRPLLKYCGFPFHDFTTTPFAIHHYIGTYEQYSARADDRRTREKFNKKALSDHGKTYHLQGWLQKFIEKVGVEQSIKLLHEAGKVHKIYPNSITIDEMPDYPEDRGLAFGKKECYRYFDQNGEIVPIIME